MLPSQEQWRNLSMSMNKSEMKLSEAIRRGAAQRHQVKHTYFQLGGSCALGPAFEGATGHIPTACSEQKLSKLFPFAYDGRRKFKDPASTFSSTKTYSPLATLIFILNDDAGWTREQIADYLEEKGL